MPRIAMLVSTMRVAVRTFLEDRGFTAAALLALVVGIAANTAVFTLVNGIYLRDLPFADPDRVVAISTMIDGDAQRPANMSLPDLRDVQAGTRSFTGIGAADEGAMHIVDADHPADRIAGAYVTGNTFTLLGVEPALGRAFTAADERAGAEPVAMLGAALWRSRYGGDRSVLGRTLRVDGVATIIVGVMPDGFGFPTAAGLWVPLTVRVGVAHRDRGLRTLDAFGRLADGVTAAQATTELAAVMKRLERDYPDTNAGIGPRVRPFRDSNTSGVIALIFSGLSASAALLLFIACANVANLLLARSAGRAREISLRLSLGAGRRQLVAQLLTESLLLSGVAASLGVPLAVLAVRLFHDTIRGTGEPYWLDFSLDARVLAYTVGLTVVTAVAFGLVPALQTTRRSLVEVLGSGHNQTTPARSRRWIGGLIVAQVALAVTLMTGAGLLLRNLQVQVAADAGVDISDMFVLQLDLPGETYPDAASRRRFYRELDEQLAAMSGVRAGSGTWAPLGGAFSRSLTIEGREPPADPSRAPRVSSLMVGTTYFEAIGIRPVRGRLFTPGDASGAPVAVVNDAFARRFFGDDSALGRRISLGARTALVPETVGLTIVGVVPNVRHEEADAREVESAVYLPHAALPLPFGRVVARGSDAAGVTAAIRAAVTRIDPTLPVDHAVRIREAQAADLFILWVFGGMFAVFAVAALLVVAVGLYGMTAYAAAMRVRELAVRVALGASTGHVAWVVVRRTALQVFTGLLIGGVGAALTGLVIRQLLTSISPFDGPTLVAVGTACLVAALASCIRPAYRAIRTDPIGALRES